MTACEMCGKKPAKFNTAIEGTTMHVCADCASFGEIKGRSDVRIVYKEKPKFEKKEPTIIFIQGYGARVKRAREKLGLKQEEMAKRLNERESLLHQIESEHLKPSVELARKLERELHVKIVEEISDEESHANPTTPLHAQKNSAYTFGDYIKKR